MGGVVGGLRRSERRTAVVSVAACSGGLVEAGMSYEVAGAGRPLILIHGLVGSAENWRRSMDALAQQATVYAIDLVNMGRSERTADADAGLAATADGIAAFMDAVGLAQADVAGHSHGGAVSMMLAARHPERVRSLVLFAPPSAFCSLGNTLVRFYLTPVGRVVARMVPYLPRWVHQFALKRMYGDPSRVTPGTVAGYSDGLAVPGTIPHILAILGTWFADLALLKDLLPRLTGVPTLLVWGDRDRAVGLESGLKLQQAIPHAELRVVHGAGHVAFDEAPEECNRLMRDWLWRGKTVELRPVAEEREVGRAVEVAG